MATALKMKPEKPYPEFPLFAHAAGVWAKKIRGKLHYFGPWDNWQAALQKYREQVDDLQAGRKPRSKNDGLLLKDLCNQFLTFKRQLVLSGELSPRTLNGYKLACQFAVEAFGATRLVEDLRSDDFQRLRATLAEGRNAVSLGDYVRCIRILFRYAYDEELIDRPVKWGTTFKEPSKKIKRRSEQKHRQKHGARMFEASELRLLLDYLDGNDVVLPGIDEETGERRKVDGRRSPQLRAMVALAINAGLGQSDLANLPQSALDLKRGWLDYPRPKTAVERRVPLWPETVEAAKKAIVARPAPKNEANEDLVFITSRGEKWVRVKINNPGTKDEKITPIDSITLEFGKLLDRLGLKRRGLHFYAIRHTTETVGGEAKDQVALDHVMGHAPPSDDMSDRYREKISDARLKAVTDHVHQWLFTKKQYPFLRCSNSLGGRVSVGYGSPSSGSAAEDSRDAIATAE